MRLVALVWRRLISPLVTAWLRFRGIRCGSGGVFYGVPHITLVRGARLTIGHRAVMCSKSAFTALGVSRPTILRGLSPGAVIVVGHDVGLSGVTICAQERVEIGSQCLVGADVVISDTDFHPLAPPGRRYRCDGVRHAPVRIGNNVFIGTRSIILKGVAIGDNTVIGAGSVVAASIPANSIAAGNPCRVIRTIDAGL